jgi:hypothetical protein
LSTLVLVGYFPRRTNLPAGLSFSTNVDELCSVSDCLKAAPENWVEHWRHNDLGFFNTCQDALSILPPDASGFSLFAYRLLPIRYLKDQAEPIEIAAQSAEPLPPGFVSLGFDVVNKTFSAFFECSPLSCNGMADEVAVNRFCLVATLDEAIAFAERCAREEPEPGPFYVLEVLRQA